MAGKKRVSGNAIHGELAAKIVAYARERGGTMTLDELTMELGQTHRFDIVASLRELESNGVGTFIVGRKGNKSRFVWSEEYLAEAAPAPARLPVAADAPRNARTEPSAAAAATTASASPEQQPSPQPTILQHSFHLRPGLVTVLHLPANLTAAEVERLCGFLRAIPFA